jgi:hypothetical protein
VTTTWFGAFLLTHLIEIPSYALLARPRGARGALAGLVGTSLTHPVLWFVGPQLGLDRLTFLVVGEVSVTLVETVVFWAVTRLPWWRAAVAAFVANALSLAIGLTLRAYGF